MPGLAILIPLLAAQSGGGDSSFFRELHWRMIGPFRGGRTVAASGVPGRPGLFYIGVNNGGVWKTTDAGRVWTPIFDAQPTGSIGALAVAPSDPNVIYVGSGEGLQRPDLSTGDGVYKSTDGGATWTHLGLRDGQQIPALLVDPHDPSRVFAAVLGHPYGPNAERGVYRSTDGGQTWQQVLSQDENTGAVDLAFDPASSQTVYAVLWAARQAPWEIGSSWTVPGGGLFKSTDGGTTWRRLTEGLPGAADSLGRIGLGVAPSLPGRIYAIVGAPKLGGLYRSDDAGEHWRRVNGDQRVWGRDGDFNEVKVDPKHPDIVYVANIVTWKSTDGGATFTAFRGAPGGDDYHRVWIDPDDPGVVLIAGDQGAIVTVNGGATWSSWYNQPTAQLYHVATDDEFPYHVYGGQQESGSVGIASRGNDGAITFHDWHPVGAEEYGYVAPDPLHPDVVYGDKVTRYDRRTGQTQDVTPQTLRTPDYRVVRTEPLVFSPVDRRVLYFASNVVWKTADGGRHWVKISPDLTRPAPAVPKNLGVFAAADPEQGKHRGVIYALAPSPLDGKRLWAGTDDGLIHVTTDGGRHWRDVTPPALTPWAKVSILEASHFDSRVAYAAVNAFRLDDLRPHLYRTRDGGATWTAITGGLPDGGIVNVVREDPKRRGLLYCGTERTVYVSFDDGDHWQSLRLNLPATSIRDLVIHVDDVVIATHGRSFWILDDVTPLRQLRPATADSDVVVFRPQLATRVRWNTNTDTPLPPDEPAGENPPDGAIVDYYLRTAAAGAVTLEIVDSAGRVVRRYASDDRPPPRDTALNIPEYWIRPFHRLDAGAGLHRFVWDLHWPPPAVREFSYPIAAVPGNTARAPHGPWALPGRYTVTLTVNGRAYRQPLVVRMDPRVRTPAAGLVAQFALSRTVWDALRRDSAALAGVRALRSQVAELKARPGAPGGALDSLDRKLEALAGGARAAPGAPPPDDLSRLSGQLAQLYDAVQGADEAPTSQAQAAARDRAQALARLVGRWRAIEAQVYDGGSPTR